MIEETGQVVALRGDQAGVQALAQGACQSCKVRGGCGQRLMAEMIGDNNLPVYVDNRLGARVGDQVVLGMGEAALLQASLLVYLVPLLGLVGGGLVGDRILALGDAGTALMAVVGMALCLLGGARFQRRAGSAQFRPVLLKILPERVPGSAPEGASNT